VRADRETAGETPTRRPAATVEQPVDVGGNAVCGPQCVPMGNEDVTPSRRPKRTSQRPPFASVPDAATGRISPDGVERHVEPALSSQSTSTAADVVLARTTGRIDRRSQRIDLSIDKWMNQLSNNSSD
jgi:hypothetical protein